MAPLVKETAKLLRSTMPANIDIKVDAEPGRDAVTGDPVQMQQVLVNLATNAVQAMPDGGAMTIALKEISLAKKDLPDPGLRPGAYLTLSVTDTGEGMDEEARSHLFEPFFTQKGSQGGSGLGLSVVYGIVKAHGGAVTVQTERGEGSALTVFLPLTEADGKRDEVVPHTEVKGRGRILFVDDEELVATAAGDALSRLGYDVTTETEPEKALRIFSGNRTYDMVITDQAMPEMTGMALARRLLDIRPGLPIILCTGYSSGVNEKSAKAAGIKAFLMKPYTRGELSEVVAKVLPGKKE
jgi:CheY-like chemotaxis protein